MWLSVGHHRLHRVSKPQRRGKNASAEESGIPQRAVYRVETMWLGFTLEDARRIPKEWSRDTPSVIVNLKRVLYICQNNKCEEHAPWQDEVLSFCSLPNWLEGLWFNSSGQWIQDVLDVLAISCIYFFSHYRRKFRSLTSDNMDSWKADQRSQVRRKKINTQVESLERRYTCAKC